MKNYEALVEMDFVISDIEAIHTAMDMLDIEETDIKKSDVIYYLIRSLGKEITSLKKLSEQAYKEVRNGK